MKDILLIKVQADKFKEAARKHVTDEDETAWDKRLKKVVEHKPVGPA